MTDDIASALTQAVQARREPVLAAWAARVGETLRGRATATSLQRDLTALLDAVLAGLDSGDAVSGPAFADARGILVELSRSRARQGFSPTETAVAVFALKQAVLEQVVLQGGEGADDVRLYRAFARLSDVVDNLGLVTFEAYAATREAVITEQAAQLTELSTPVVKLWDGVVAVPLIGTLDSARTQVVMEKLLQALVDTGSDQAIIDITGVPAVDTQVAQHLLKTVMAARLMGADCIISGIRPQIAQTVVALGIQFQDIVTKASLADALVLALRRSGVEVVRRGGGRPLAAGVR